MVDAGVPLCQFAANSRKNDFQNPGIRRGQKLAHPSASMQPSPRRRAKTRHRPAEKDRSRAECCTGAPCPPGSKPVGDTRSRSSVRMLRPPSCKSPRMRRCFGASPACVRPVRGGKPCSATPASSRLFRRRECRPGAALGIPCVTTDVSFPAQAINRARAQAISAKYQINRIQIYFAIT
jgi:hypothetical protein